MGILRRPLYLGNILRSPVIREFAASLFLVAVVVGCCYAGGVVLSLLEGAQEDKLLEERRRIQEKLKAELSEETYSELVNGGWLSGVTKKEWDINDPQSRAHAFLFAFTLASTIGYGNVKLYTEDAKIFAALFSLLTIPLTITAYTYLAKRLVGASSFLVRSLSEDNATTFRKYDTDFSGKISLSEFRSALMDLGYPKVSVNSTRRIMEELNTDKDATTLSYTEFCGAIRLLEPPTVKRRSKRIRTACMLLMLACYVLIGAWTFSHTEGWDFNDALWFSWITIATIGLGDFVPISTEGASYLVLWGTGGLGILALVWTTVTDLMMSSPIFAEQAEDHCSKNLEDLKQAAEMGSEGDGTKTLEEFTDEVVNDHEAAPTHELGANGAEQHQGLASAAARPPGQVQWESPTRDKGASVAEAARSKSCCLAIFPHRAARLP